MAKEKKVLTSNIVVDGVYYERGTEKKKIKKEHIEAIGEGYFEKEKK